MNQFKNFAQKVAQAVPKGGAGAGGAGGEPPVGSSAAIAKLLLLGVGAYSVASSITTVQPGHRGFIYNRLGGINDKKQLNEGINFVVPWFQRAVIYDVRTRAQQIDTHSGSKGR